MLNLTKCLIFLFCFGRFFFMTAGAQSNDSSNFDGNVVQRYGQLKVSGTKIKDMNGRPVTLRGMSLFWSQWMGKYYNDDCIRWLVNDWHCSVVRAAMGVDYGGYLQHPEKELKKVKKVIDASIELGIYVIVDWHSHSAEKEQQQAIQFFGQIASEYGNRPNIIYEIYNEPVTVSWDSVIKPYAGKVIAAIRQYDPDNIIIVGTPHWSQDVDKAANDPLKGSNIAYSLHYYASSHKQWLRDKAEYALNKGLALWVTEFGTCEANGNGPIDYKENEAWFAFMEKYGISYCNWSVADKKETASALKPHASARGGWTPKEISESGKMVRNKLRQF